MSNTLHKFFIHFIMNKHLFNLSTQLSTEKRLQSPILRFKNRFYVDMSVDKLDNFKGCPGLHNDFFAKNIIQKKR